jgi:hypothetical protein
MSTAAVANEFYVSQQFVSNIVNEVSSAIIAELKEAMFPVPTRETWQRSAKIFGEKWGFERAIGALDGKHFACKVS